MCAALGLEDACAAWLGGGRCAVLCCAVQGRHCTVLLVCRADSCVSVPVPASPASIPPAFRLEAMTTQSLASLPAPLLTGAGEEVEGWLLHDSCQPLESIHCLQCSGFVRHAFVLAFHHLRQRTPFVDAIRLTLMRGGDTDTNAAIVGGLMGALHSAAAIPDWMVRPVLEYEGRQDQGGGVPRPPELRAACLPDLASQLYQQATA